MYTYTTPTITCHLTDVDFTNVDYVRIAVGGGQTPIVKQVDIEDIDTEHGIATISLTQEETASLGTGQVSVQARVHYDSGSVQATNKVTLRVNDVIDKVVI